MSIKKSLAFAVSIFLMASGLDAAAGGAAGGAAPVCDVLNLTKLLNALGAANTEPNKYESSVAVAARAEFIKLSEGEFVHILCTVPIFQTAYGFSLIHGWMLSKLTSRDLPFYVNQHFSFDKYIRNLIAVMSNKKYQDAKVKEHITAKWNAVRNAIEADRWAYYQHMQYISAAIAQAGMGGITAAPVDKAYVLTLQGDNFRDHIDSIIVGGIPADVPLAQAKLESIMIGLLKHYNLDKLLKYDTVNLNLEKFVEFVVEHVPALYRVPSNISSVYRVKLGQTGEDLRVFVNNLIRVGGQVAVPVGAAGAATPQQRSVNDVAYRPTILAAIEFVRQYLGLADHIASTVEVSPSLVPAYYNAPGGYVAPKVERDGNVHTPRKEVGTRAAAPTPVTPFSPSKYLGGHLAIKADSPAVQKMQTVHSSPLMDKWIQSVESGAQLQASDIAVDEAADILKYFASYLEKVKQTTSDVDSNKGPYTADVFLSNVLAMRYELLALGKPVLGRVITSINSIKKNFYNSLKSQGIASLVTVVDDLDPVRRNLFGGS
jgi:hypothetical protein